MSESSKEGKHLHFHRYFSWQSIVTEGAASLPPASVDFNLMLKHIISHDAQNKLSTKWLKWNLHTFQQLFHYQPQHVSERMEQDTVGLYRITQFAWKSKLLPCVEVWLSVSGPDLKCYFRAAAFRHSHTLRTSGLRSWEVKVCPHFSDKLSKKIFF